MLDRLAPDTHLLRMLIETLLRRLDHVLVLPARDATLRTGRALRLKWALRARAGPVVPQVLSILLRRIPIDQQLTGRTAVDISVGQIGEVLLAEATLRLRTRAQWLRQRHRDVGLLARQDRIAIEVPAVRDHLELVGIENRLRLLCHVGEL